MSKIHVVVGGQFGSEGKGHFAAALIKRGMEGPWELVEGGRGELVHRPRRSPVLVRVAGPNAGHTAYDDQGREWKLRQIPVGAVVDLEAPIVLGAGSEIDPEVLRAEIEQLEAAEIPVVDRLLIDWQATVIEERHRLTESRLGMGWESGKRTSETLVDRIGSTGKGIGAARADRLMRGARIWGDVKPAELLGFGSVLDTARYLRLCLEGPGGSRGGRDVLIEGTQGYGLGLHAGYYPYCTSSDCRVVDFLAMAGLNQWDGEVVPWVVLRNEVIRVAGNSGPLLNETTWAEKGLPEEKTTVTKKVRRVGGWDAALAAAAVTANGGNAVRVAYTMADHSFPALAEVTSEQYRSRTKLDDIDDAMVRIKGRMEEIDAGGQLEWVGTGPNTGIWI